MFPSYIGILDIQSWWEVPSIAYFCSLFRTAFNLLDFDIEELEEALLTDGTEESACSLLTELIVRLLNGCLGNNDISAFNYQMYLRRLFRRKCQETGRYNPFNTDIDFQFLPLRTKVEILYALCDFRLDATDVFDLFKNLEAESLRVEPLGWDDNDSAYWYFYGTRLYREDIIKKPKGKNKKKKGKESKKRGWFYGDDWLDDDETERVWQVVCFTEEDWTHLTEKFSTATSKVEKELHRSLSQNFLPEIPRLFQEKERLQRKRLLELAPRRTSSRVLQKIKQKEEETKQGTHEIKEEEDIKEVPDLAREIRAKRRNLLRSKSVSSSSSESLASEKEDMPLKVSKRSKSQDKRSKNSSTTHKGEPPPEPVQKSGRKTNNSLASATGQILIPDNDEPVSSTRKKLKTSQIFSQTEEDIQTDMYKVLEQLTGHEDAWPFMDPVEEEYAPNYYAVIRRPMDLHKMEERLDSGHYTDFAMFKADFKLIVNNCRLYNGQDNEYTAMVDNLQAAFDRLTEKYMHKISSSDEEIAVEFQMPTPSRKHKLKSDESPSQHKRKKRKSHSDTGEPKSSSSDQAQEEKLNSDSHESGNKKTKESHKNKESKGKKKRKGHHRHGKHSKNHRKNSHRSDHSETFKSKRSKKQKHGKTKNKESKKSKQKKKKNKHQDTKTTDTEEIIKRSVSHESLESSNRSRSASPLPSIHTLSPSPTELSKVETPEQLTDPDFFKDKYDKIKERRRNAAKDAWESLFDYKQKVIDKQKQNLNIPERDKNQKLRETIEKLKAKSEKYKNSTLFNSLFSTNKNCDVNIPNETIENVCDEVNLQSSENSPVIEKEKKANKKGNKRVTAKNESASEALEQAVKDISKWLDDAPKTSAASSPCDSPAQTISTEEHENSRLDDEFPQGERTVHGRKEITRKRPASREVVKVVKRREIQRTIDRLQPGKSKGNLLTKNTEKVEEITPLGPFNKVRDVSKAEETSPKLSLGSVLPTVEFTLGEDHKFGKDEERNDQEPDNVCNTSKLEVDGGIKEDIPEIKKTEEPLVQSNKKDAEVETEPITISKPSQEKATPNLSAWFKAFGAPKSTPTSNTIKKKADDTEVEEKPTENTNHDNKGKSPKNKYEALSDSGTPNPDGGDSPLPNANVTPRQRRTSTGSSVSERSSFSQDLDSPRHQMSHTSPLLCSPASPRTEDFQKITYPIINGTVRAGFYQDTTSMKSSPEKNCSPREAPLSPYSPYSQHVYASNSSIVGSTTPTYFVDQSKSPLPTYGQNPPPYYDTSKAPVVTKPGRSHDDYTALCPDSYQQNEQNQYGPFSPPQPYVQNQAPNYSQAQISPLPATDSSSPVTSVLATADPKTAPFPVKKRNYSEIVDDASINISQIPDITEPTEDTPAKNDQIVKKLTHTISPTQAELVSDIAAVLTEKTEIKKIDTSQETVTVDYKNCNVTETSTFDTSETISEKKNDNNNIEFKQPIGMTKKDSVDLINMGYINPIVDRRNNTETHDEFSITKEVLKSNLKPQHKGYEVDAIAMSLGMHNAQLQKTFSKPIPPAHVHDRSLNDINSNQNIVNAHTHTHHNQFEAISNVQPIGNFSLSDIEIANKKLYSCNVTSSAAAIDYGNWKMTSPITKQGVLPSDYSIYNSNNTEKLKPDLNTSHSATINYNKNSQQQYSSYKHGSLQQRPQDLQHNPPSELRIPNPRGLLKNDQMIVSPTISNSELVSKNVDTSAKLQKSDKLVQNHPMVSPMQYKASYNTHSSMPLESQLRNLPNIPHILERYTNNERYLSGFATGNSSLYSEKSFQMAQMYNKNMSSDVQTASTPATVYTQSLVTANKDSNASKAVASVTPIVQGDIKTKSKRKRTTDSNKAQAVSSQGYHISACNSDVLSTKSSMVPGSAFNFGASALGSGLYGDNSGFSIEDFRSSTANQLMAANYMAAAVAHQQQQQQQRNNAEANAEKMVKPAHQNSSHASGTFPFIGHSQVRAGYPFVGAESSSPLYQQYLRQEELLRQTGQMMGLYPPGYPASLGVRQPYDSINRHSWL